ncbi:Protein of uncharacterised function (DUF3037) [Serratia proteamaculans]|uniref:DUF3037 domain-containing protein n=1 Tax=Serratia proteamaculans TaxID=28151 RepID=UPI0021829379|nr:DUF3037 domain-containing protein [Serratia proteamaculans]CAI2539337.1 Protein of uncharacterised function (DUF3037) [Serratia proteamaculans]
MSTPCMYSIIRYLPYTDTEEFANIGVILCAPKTGYLSYKLAPKNNGRVRTFFNDTSIYPIARDSFNNELKFINGNASAFSDDVALANFFIRYVEKRESIFQFSDVRVSMAKSPINELDRLYQKFVNASEVTKERREEILARELKERFRQQGDWARFFKQESLGKELSKFSMPLVLNRDGVVDCAIKPLAFDQDEPGKMVEHCDTWVARITRAASEGILDLSKVLLPLAPPISPDSKQTHAMRVIRETFDKNDISTIEHEKQDSIIDFARHCYITTN